MRARSGRRETRVFHDPLVAGAATLDEAQSHYLGRVLRLDKGSELLLFDGRGTFAKARIIEKVGRAFRIEIDEPQHSPAPPLQVTVALSTPKGERADWAVEKLTELGINAIVWLQCERSVAEPRPRRQRWQRWQRLAQAAAAQSGRLWLPSIAGPLQLDELLRREADVKLIASFEGTAVSTLHPDEDSSRFIFVVGPEGGLTTHELALAREAGYTAVNLGENTLRVETAAVVGSALLLATLAA